MKYLVFFAFIFLFSQCGPAEETPAPQESNAKRIKVFRINGSKLRAFSYDSQGRILTDSAFSSDNSNVYSVTRYVYSAGSVEVWYRFSGSENLYSKGRLNSSGQIEFLSMNFKDSTDFSFSSNGISTYNTKTILVANETCESVGFGKALYTRKIGFQANQIDSVITTSTIKAGEPRPNPNYVPGLNDSLICVFIQDSSVTAHYFTYNNPTLYQSVPTIYFGVFSQGYYGSFTPSIFNQRFPSQIVIKTTRKNNSGVTSSTSTVIPVTNVVAENGLVKSFRTDQTFTFEY